jgi:hypothetical protein
MRADTAISAHAISRYQERVDPSASRYEAYRALKRFLTRGRARATARHWMRETPAPKQARLLRNDDAPNQSYVYCSCLPGVCLIVRDCTVVTVLTRELCRSRRQRQRQAHRGETGHLARRRERKHTRRACR